MTNSNNYSDPDPQETQEWIESIRSILETSGTDRTHFILEKLIEFARRNGVRMPYSATTDYVNTIPLGEYILLHFRMPSLGLMTKMNSCL